MNTLRLCFCAVLLTGMAVSPTSWPALLSHAPLPPQAPLAGDLLSQLPLYFIENRGQVGAAARYYIQGRDRTLYFTPDGVIFRLAGDPAAGSPAYILTLQFAGADPTVRPEGVDRAEMTVSYFTGPPDRWRTGLPSYAGLLYRDLWPGIDLIWPWRAAG